VAELLPGLHQLEQVLGPRYLYQYLLIGERAMLVDTGIATSPDEVILPYFQQIDFEPAQLDYILISHADVDHMGGNARMQQVAPQAIFACHHLDARWIGSRERIIAERYGWYKQFEMDYPAEVADWLDQAMGPDVRIDLHLTGDEIFNLDDNRPVQVLHLPGHSDGHIGLYDEVNRAAIIIDAVLWRGLLNMENQVISPPPYSTIEGYLAAIDAVLALDFEHLYTGHYANKSGDEARRFLEESKAFVYRCHQAVADVLGQAGRPLELAEIHHGVDQLLGPYSAFAVELAKPVHAHLDRLVSEGQAAVDQSGGQPTWKAR
jgi:glyoxylase-like metal-dependent hydrolase (beta-lactamase superfamily II)